MNPKPATYQVNLESGLFIEDDMLPMGHCQVLPPLGPFQREMAVVGSQQWLPCESIDTVTKRLELVVFWPAPIPF